MLKVGVMLKHTTFSEMAFRAILSGNLSPHLDVSIYFDILSKPCINPKFAIFNASEVYNHDGPVIATDIRMADRLLSCPGPHPKIFYINDLEWYKTRYDFKYLSNIYTNDKLHLIARSQTHLDIIESVWHKKCSGHLDNFDITTVLNMVGITNE